jgi:hypothetical protein
VHSFIKLQEEGEEERFFWEHRQLGLVRFGDFSHDSKTSGSFVQTNYKINLGKTGVFADNIGNHLQHSSTDRTRHSIGPVVHGFWVSGVLDWN